MTAAHTTPSAGPPAGGPVDPYTSPSDLPPDIAALGEPLRAGAQALGLALDAAQTGRMLHYLALIAKWNRVYNLTAIRDPHDMLTHHLLDSLAVVPPLQREAAALRRRGPQDTGTQNARLSLLDVGAGAGLPGVVIAICCHDIRVVCVDTVTKKAAFVQQVAAALALPNLAGQHARVESLTGPFDIVASRAFAALADFTAWSAPALAPAGVWMAMKGKLPADEIAALRPEVSVFHVEPLDVPGLGAERCLVWMRPAASAV